MATLATNFRFPISDFQLLNVLKSSIENRQSKIPAPHPSPLIPLIAFLLLPLAALAQETTGVLVANQGNFGDGNGSITFYDLNAADEALGDFGTIIQSILLHDDAVYVMSNTGGRVDVLDAQTLERTAQIPNVDSPRYMAVVSDEKAYVTSQLFNDPAVVTILDLTTNEAAGTIEVGGTPEGIAVRGGKAYVALGGFGGSGDVAVIDIATDTVDETLSLDCDGVRMLTVDAQDELHVFCTGTTVYNEDFTEIIEQTNGAIITLGTDHSVVGSIALGVQIGTTGPGQDVHYAPEAEEAHVVIDDTKEIYRFDTATNALVDTLMVSGDDGIGAVAYDGFSERLYVGRSTGFTTDGYVTIYDRTGAEAGSFNAGFAPAHIVFRRSDVGSATGPVVEVPRRSMLHPAYPNPFNPATTLPFEVVQSGPVRLTIVNVLGQTVATLIDGTLGTGSYEAKWDAAEQPSGLYLARLEAGGTVSTRQLVLVK